MNADRVSEPISRAGIEMEPAVCCLCGVDDADPVAAGEDFEYRTCPDTFHAVRCRRCRILYLNPRPAAAAAARIYPDTYHAFQFDAVTFGLVHRVRRRLEARRLLSFARGLPAAARVLDVGCGDGFHLRLLAEYGPGGWALEGVDTDARAVRAAGPAAAVHHGALEALDLPGAAYDLVLLIMTLEHVADPLGLLLAARERLAPRGRLVVVTDNAAAPDAWLFRRRHWGGYHFPRHTYLFDARNLRALARAAGLRPVRVRTGVSPVNWVYSVRNTLDDWGLPRWVTRRFSLTSVPALAAFTVLDGLLTLLGRGGNLRAVFRCPDPKESQR